MQLLHMASNVSIVIQGCFPLQKKRKRVVKCYPIYLQSDNIRLDLVFMADLNKKKNQLDKKTIDW